MSSSAFFRSFLLISLLLISGLGSTKSQEVEDESEFSYLRGAPNGPENWGNLNHSWRECKTGKMQSPIDLTHERVKEVGYLGRLKRNYKLANSTLKNRGHDMMLKWVDDAGYIKINGTEYHLKQLHWHSPSEHTVNGRSYDMEAHLVHESTDKKIAVLGIMYKIGRQDKFLAELMELMKSIADSREKEVNAGVINPKHVKLGSRKYYRYLGSLTTPPCKEGVIWTILKKVRTVSREQVRLLRFAVHDDAEMNARPTQAFNHRHVVLYNPRLEHQNNKP